MSAARRQSVAHTVAGFAANAAARDVPDDIIDEAVRATTRAFSARGLSDRGLYQMEAYFSAVVRRRIVRSRRGTKAVARIMAAAVVADLTESGRGPSAVWEELERGWTGMIPDDVLEEYRTRLCA